MCQFFMRPNGNWNKCNPAYSKPMARPMLAASFYCRSLTAKLSDLSLLPRNGLFHCRYFTDQPSDAPRRPKRPANAYFLFKKKMTPEVMKQYPEASMIDATRKVGELYKQLPEEEKLELKKEADKLLDDYKQQVKYWEIDMGSNELEEFKQDIKNKRDIKKKKIQKQTLKKLLKETDKPLRPPSAYFLFIRDAREIALKSRKKPETNAERRKFIDECAQKWKQMSEQEKQLVAKQYEDFQAKMSVWEKGMIEAGMESLVRKTTRKKMNIETTQEGQVKAKANKRGTKTKVKSTRSKGKVKVETTGT
ncbi:transcription factor A, mitochondrial-like isoform X9 [Dreissena polymorpha]|uniref:transcription factor A, mitochondrial-like isoform X9 n=1 Tax=Dreissena polymorpha TaxID=45954 RepID=UPI0022650700|nr:transcription factor A, mitochondrial-like isoform X9 [Dreissena polymorpha]